MTHLNRGNVEKRNDPCRQSRSTSTELINSGTPADREKLAAVLGVLTDDWGELLGYLKRRVQGVLEAEDILQTAVLKALQRSNQLRNPSQARAWVYGILRHTLTDAQRQQVVQRSQLVPLPAESVHGWAESPHQTDHGRTQRGHLCECGLVLLDQLEPRQSDLLRRVILEGEPLAEVADSLGINSNALHARLLRARRRLRAAVEDCCGITSPAELHDCSCSGPAASD